MEPIVAASPRRLNINYNGHGVVIDVAQIEEYSHHIHGEVTIHYNEHKLLQHETVNFSVRGNLDKTESRCVKILSSYGLASPDTAPPWDLIFEDCRIRVIEHHREKANATNDTQFLEYDSAQPPTWLLKPFMIKDDLNIIFADGGAGKSKFSLALYLVASMPWPDNPLGWIVYGEEHRSGLIFDWESGPDRTQYNLRSLLNGFKMPPFAVNYSHQSLPIYRNIEKVKELIAKYKAEFIIIDSIGMAAGGDLNATEPAFEFCAAIRELAPITTLAIGHTSKSAEKRKTLFGSAYYSNEARNIWELRQSEVPLDDGIAIACYHRKANDVRKIKEPLPYLIKFDSFTHSINISTTEIKNFPDLKEDKNHAARILRELSLHDATIDNISRNTDIPYDTVKTEINRLVDQKRVAEAGKDGKKKIWRGIIV